MNREERINRARALAAERRPELEAREAERVSRIDGELSDLSSQEAQALISLVARQGEAEFLGPERSPHEWKTAVAEARRVTIGAARRGVTITYGEIRLAVYRLTGMLVGYSMFGRLVMEMNRGSDGVLLSSIVVRQADGTPGDGFAGYARSQGFDAPLATLQRQVFERFGGAQ